MLLRETAKKLILTGNTARYAVEMPRLKEALKVVGVVDTFLDVGAGGGHYATNLYLPVCRHLIAVEYSGDNFALLRRSLAPYSDRAKAIQGSATELPVPDASMDCIACTQVLEHIVAHQVVANEFARVLKPGGYALITVPHPPAPWPEDDHVREGYRHEELDALFLPRGFKRVYSDWFFTLGTQRTWQRIRRWSRGRFPNVLRFAENHATKEQRREQQPYAILALYRKD